MILLSVVSAIGVVMLAREQARTSANFARAERHFQQARSAVDQLGLRIADRLLEIPGAETVRRDLLVDTLVYYQQFAAEAGNDPHLEQELALAHFKSAMIAGKIGATADAIRQYEAAQQILAEIAKNESAPDARAQLAVTHNNLGLLLAARGEVDAARDHYQEAIALQQKLVAADAKDVGFTIQLAESRANLGMLLDQIGDADGAEQSLRAAVEGLRYLAAATQDPKATRNLAIACNNLSYVVRKRDLSAAESLAREAVAVLEQLSEQHPTAAYQDDLALCYNNLAALIGQNEQSDESIRWHKRAIALQEQLVRKAPAVVRHRSDLAITLNNLGMAYCRAAREADADAAFAKAWEIFATLADDYPDELAYRSSLAALLNNQAVALAGAGRHQAALEIYPTAIESQRDCWQQLQKSPLMRELLSKMYYNYGQSLRSVGDRRDAVEVALKRRELWRGDGERLFGVAAELAEADVRTPKVDEEIVATLWEAFESGWPQDAKLDADDRFARLRTNERFAALAAKVDEQPGKSGERLQSPSADSN
jgi:tetratricopeptide (TPR) repeat protein